MKPVDQTTFGKKHGNCLAACVASITELPLASLAFKWDDREDGEHWYDTLRNALRPLGWRAEYETAEVPSGYCIASGMAARGLKHSVVFFDGKLAHDPHPSRAGLLDEEFYITLSTASEGTSDAS